MDLAGIGYQIHMDALIKAHKPAAMGNGKRQEVAIGDLGGGSIRSQRMRPLFSRLICLGQKTWLAWLQASSSRGQVPAPSSGWRPCASEPVLITQLVDLPIGDQFWIGCPEGSKTRNQHRSSIRPISFTREGHAQQP